MVEATLIKKLGIKGKQRIVILNPPVGYAEHIGSLLPPEVELIATPSPEDSFDIVILFVRNKTEVEKDTPIAIERVKTGGRLWLLYPKQSSKVPTDINRDVLWKIFPDTEWRPVTQIAVDEVWSALRFRPKTEVGT